MTKKQLEEENIRLRKQIEQYERLVDAVSKFDVLFNKLVGTPSVDNETCPMGGMHSYNKLDTAGWRCKCGKTIPYEPFPSTITFDGPKM